MKTGWRAAAVLGNVILGAIGLELAIGSGADLAAQEVSEVRILAVVDYVAGDDVYLAAGTDHGPRAADTLRFFDGAGSGAEFLGFLHIVSATLKRSVANVIGEPFPVEKGAALYLVVPSERLREIEQRDSAKALPGNPTNSESAEPEQEASPPPLPIVIHGRASLDFNALRTITRWGEGPGAQEERSFNTPTFRLHARAQNIPGGFELETGVRIAHRMSTDSIVQPVTSTRLYQFDLEKTFDRIPLELHLGRFYNRFEEFSGFWDGMLLRFGPRALGGGVAIGFEPKLSNEGFSSQRPKVSGFVDFDTRGETLGYSGSLSFLGIRPQDGFPERTMVGLSQRIRIGQAWIHNRIQADRDPAGSDWNITRIQVDGSLNLGGGLSGFAGWRRWRAVPLWEAAAVLGPQEDRGHFGFSYWGAGGGGSLNLSVSRPEEGESGRTLSGSFHLTKTPIPGVGLGGAASYWSRGDEESLMVAPEIRLSAGRFDLRGTYRRYASSTFAEKTTTQFTDVGLSLPLGGGAYLRLQGSKQFGGDLSSTRLFASLWKSF